MKSLIRHNCFLLMIFVLFVPSLLLSVTQNEPEIHIRKSSRNFGASFREYKFNNVVPIQSRNASFNWENVKLKLSKESIEKLDIEYWIHTSVENAEFFMVERLDLTSIYLKNIIDFPLSEVKIGDNCWYQNDSGYILFIRNNIWIGIKPKKFGSRINWEIVEETARLIDDAIKKGETDEKTKILAGAPEIKSDVIISHIPDSGEKRIQIEASEPLSQNLYFRKYGTGLSLISEDGIFTISPQKTTNIFKNSTDVKVKVWIWNENRIITSTDINIPIK